MKKIIILGLIAGFLWAFSYFDLGHYLTLEYIKEQQANFSAFYKENALLAMGAYSTIYIVTTALSLPGAALLTLLGGALFGLVTGTILVSFASTIGATLAFLVSRLLLRDWVQDKFGRYLESFNDGIKKDGALYLFTLRLIPAVPFFVINLVMGLTPMKTGSFFLVSQVGMLAGTLVFINAGTQLAQIESLRGILSTEIIFSFVLLGIFPLLAKKIMNFYKRRKVMSKFKKPESFDYNMVVIGAGSAGLVTSYIGAATRGKVALIEKHKMGGDCLNTGCVPSKALIRSAKFMADVKNCQKLGFKSAQIEFDFADVMERVQRVIKTIEPHDSIERYTSLGVECHTGEAKILSPYEVLVNGKTLTTRNIVIGTGARPAIPLIEGIENVDYLTSDTVWNIRKQPDKLLVLGGGPIGSELSQAFARLGCSVTQVQRNKRLIPKEDPEVSQMLLESFQSEGINVLIAHTPKRFFKRDGKDFLECENNGNSVEVEFDTLLVALGRKANTTGFGLEELGIELTPQKTIKVDAYMKTNIPNIYACGDVAGPYLFTHTAAHQAWYCAVNSMLNPFYGFKADYSVVPWSTFTDPEVARSGLNELEAKEQGIPYEVTTYGIDDLDRAITDEAAHGIVKVLTVPGKDKIIGVTIAGLHAGDIIAEYVAAMKNGFGMNKILSTIHIYPTLAESNKFAAGNWKKNNVTEKTLAWGERINRWRRDYF
ncbi:MAG: FAD-dependent oxidoreductase [Nitrospinae bacterium]|nr:FAD-dependent oxidoreductase [Nitrospinota bacterium]MBL7019302.1 FAD-dependent oxidoreductase [Nitrospinaceae bacterium]